MDENVQRIIERAVRHKLQVSPFVALVGADLKGTLDAYIYVDGIQFNCPTLLHALDWCMKTTFALHAVYQPQSKDIWMLVQKILYKLDTPWDFSSQTIEDIIRFF